MYRFSEAVACQWKTFVTFARRQQGKSNAAQAGRQAVAVKRAAAARTGAAADGGAKGDRVATAAKPAEPETADEAAAKIKKTAPFEAEVDIGAWATAEEAAEMTSSHEGSAEAAVGALRAAEAAAAALVALKTPRVFDEAAAAIVLETDMERRQPRGRFLLRRDARAHERAAVGYGLVLLYSVDMWNYSEHGEWMGVFVPCLRPLLV